MWNKDIFDVDAYAHYRFEVISMQISV